jgi:hypothetical protein
VLRLQAVADLLKSICSRSEEELTTMLHEMEEVLEYNYRLFNSREFLDAAWKELTNNLQQAIESAPVLQKNPAIRGTRIKLITAPSNLVPQSLVDKVQ